VLTFRRPDLLAALLDCFSRIVPPSNCRVRLLVVDNDARASAMPTFAAWSDRLPAARYVVEPRLGIPVARNRALDEALACGADALCFIDDDETPASDWLVRLVEAWRQSGANLVGGPVEVAPPPGSATLLQRVMNASLAARARRKCRRTARAAARGGRYTIVTNNWLCDLRWLATTGLRFDESLLMTGGSDTAFCWAAVAAGCRQAWAADAVVREMIPPERLTSRYQFWRGMSQSITHYRMKSAPLTAVHCLATLGVAVLRAVLGLMLFAVPVFGVGSFAMAIRSLGWAAGRIQALRGHTSQLYVPAAVPAGGIFAHEGLPSVRKAA
jgi:glycosyltransferase involved in cell wall biosynthesis